MTKLIKPNNDGSITNIKKFIPNRVQKRLINEIIKQVLKSKYKNSYNNTYHTQKYSLRFIVTKIVCFLHSCTVWRDLGEGWENIYAHFKKFAECGIITNTYDTLLQKYKIKRKYGYLKVVMTDTNIILNKYGI